MSDSQQILSKFFPGQTNVLNFDFDILAQQALQNTTNNSLELALIGQDPNQSPTSASEVRFFSTESNNALEPMVEIVYNWTPTKLHSAS